jgi:Trypsin-like peptidase domain
MRTFIRAASALALVATVHGRPAAAADEVIASPVCTSSAIGRAHRAASPAIVGVVAPGPHGFPMSGTGFVFRSSRHVVTALALVENGRGIEVIVGEERVDAEVVAQNRAAGLAVLRLAHPTAARPLHVASGDLAIGEPVLALGRTSNAPDAEVVVAPGIVTGRGKTHFSSDAVDALDRRWGTPLLSCAGDVVGLTTRGDRIAPGQMLDAVARTVDDSAPYEGGWSFAHPSVSMLFQIDTTPVRGAPSADAWLGAGFGLSLIGYDRWVMPFEARALFLGGPRQPFAERNGTRLQFATGLGHRFLLSGGDNPIYLVPSVGIALEYQRITTVGTLGQIDASCALAGPCDVTLSAGDPSIATRLRWLPTAGVKLHIGPTTVGYELQLDPINPGDSTHHITLGLQF